MAEWKQPIGVDPLTGTKTQLLKEDNQLYLHHQTDSTALLDENRDLANQPQKGRTRLAARIPPHLYWIDWPTEFQAKHGYHPHRDAPRKMKKAVKEAWQQFVRAKLNSSEYRYLRVDGGKRL